MTYRDEFPDFDYDLPVIAGFVDESWHNDSCPCLSNPHQNLIIWCDYANPGLREYDSGKRFTLVPADRSGAAFIICESDDIAGIVAAIATYMG